MLSKRTPENSLKQDIVATNAVAAVIVGINTLMVHMKEAVKIRMVGDIDVVILPNIMD